MRTLIVGMAALCASTASIASAQTIIQYDTVAMDVDAAVTCGFCATEKYGTIFYEFGVGAGLPASAFPFQLNALQVAVAGTRITGDIFTGYMCAADNTGGVVDVALELYAGQTPPTAIDTLPGSGPWPGETMLFSSVAQLTRSVETIPGSNNYSVQLNSIPVNVMVSAPATYVRAVVNIPTGLSSSACMDLALQSPAISPFRDNNGLIGPNRNFIYQLGILGMASRWTWSENVSDPITMTQGIRGDWLLRLEITPAGGMPDGGVIDAGDPPDGAVDAAVDAGDTGTPMDAAPMDTGTPVDTGSPTDTGAPADTGTPTDMGSPVDMGTGLPPTIDAITPDTIDEGTAAQVTVVGTNFATDVELRIGAIAADVKLVNGSSTILADVPMGIAAGTYDVVVTNPDGQSAVLVDGFKVKGEGTQQPQPEEGCSCSTSQPASASSVVLAVLVVFGWRRRRRPGR